MTASLTLYLKQTGKYIEQYRSIDIMRSCERIEQRNFTRFPVSEGAMIAFTHAEDTTYYNNIGQIVDISRGGLAFDYERSPNGEDGVGLVALLGLNKKSFFVKDVPFEIVYDREVLSTQGGVHKKNRCGLMFSNLSERQLSQVDAFIDHYAIRLLRLTGLRWPFLVSSANPAALPSFSSATCHVHTGSVSGGCLCQAF